MTDRTHTAAKSRPSAPLPDGERRIELGRLLPLWPDELADLSEAGRHRIVQLLATALRKERRRGVSGHWTYDLARHAALLRIYNAEVGALARQNAAAGNRISYRTKRENHQTVTTAALASGAIRPHIPNDIGRPAS